jgi:hypothetical protein
LAGILVAVSVIAATRVNWNTVRRYTSADGGYSIRFPFLFTLHVGEVKVQGKNEFHPVKNIVELDMMGKPQPYILIGHSQNAEYQPIDDFIENTSECDEITDHQGEKIMIAGMEGRIFRNVSCNSGGETRIYFENGQTGYNIIFHGKPVDEKIIRLITENFTLVSKK